jgi:hypothetical protein
MMEFEEEFALVVDDERDSTCDSDDEAQDESAHIVSPSCYRSILQTSSNRESALVGYFPGFLLRCPTLEGKWPVVVAVAPPIVPRVIDLLN